MIQKQLSSPLDKYKRIGIIGTIAILRFIGTFVKNFFFATFLFQIFIFNMVTIGLHPGKSTDVTVGGMLTNLLEVIRKVPSKVSLQSPLPLLLFIYLFLYNS